MHRTESAHCSVRPSSISKLAQGHAGMNWPDPPDRLLARVRLGAVPIVPFRPRAEADCHRSVPTAPAAAPTRFTCLPVSTRHTCSCHPVCSASSHHIRSTRDACSRRPMRHPVVLSVRGRSRLSSSLDSRRTTPTLLCSHRTPLLQAPKHRPSHTALVCLCATPSRPLSHCALQATVKAPSRSPPSVSEATLPSSTTSTTDVLLHHRSNLRPSSPPLHEPKPTLSTSSPACRHRFPTAELCHHREPATVRPSTAYAPNRGPHLWGLLPGTFFPDHSPLVGRNRPASRAPVGNGETPLF
jgi:hypothetical protein